MIHTKFIAMVLGGALLAAPLTLPVHANMVVVQQADQAGAALREGRRLLKRGRADQALIQLRTALNLYTAAKNNSGMAATHNELGDLYLRQGQYPVALDNYQKALDGFLAPDPKKDAVNAVAGLGDDKYNANLMLAKIGDVNFRLGKLSDSQAAYNRMVVKKPEGAASKVGRRFGGLSAIAGGISTGRVSVEAPTSALTVALEAKKELDEYRNSIVYSSYQLGLGRLAYANNDLEGAKKNFELALEAAGSSLAGIAKLGQVRRFRAAARTSLGDIALRQGKLKDASKYYTDAKKGAQDDKRLDLMWPAQRGLGRRLWLQAGQEKDPKKVDDFARVGDVQLSRITRARSKRCGREVCARTSRARRSFPRSKTYLMKPRARMRRWRCWRTQPQALRSVASHWSTPARLSGSTNSRARARCSTC